jgi:hypothetical protein
MQVRTSFALSFLALSCGALSLSGCPAPDPLPPPRVVVPAGPTEADAKAALEAAAARGGLDDLVDVYRKYPKLPSGRQALLRAADAMLAEVSRLRDACNDEGARAALARVAPFTLELPEIDRAYDDAQLAVLGARARCALVSLDRDLAKLEAESQWPELFARLAHEQEVDAKVVATRRTGAVSRYVAWLETTIRGAATGKLSLDESTLTKLRAAVDAPPAELGSDLEKWQAAGRALLLVVDRLEEGRFVDPPRRATLSAATTARTLDGPDTRDGPSLAKGLSFFVIARGRIDDVDVVVAGEPKSDLVARLASARLVIDDAALVGTGKAAPKKAN